MVRYGWYMWYSTVGTVGTLSKVRLVRLPTVPTAPTVPVNRTTVPPYRARLRGGSRGGRFGCTNTTLVLAHSKRPPLDPPLNLVRYGGTVHWYGMYGRYGW